jgi:hypothetical protein
LVGTHNKKTHAVRVMVVLKRHSKLATFEEQVKGLFLLHDYMTKNCEGEPWFMVDNTYASVIDHWHTIACTAFASDMKEVEQLKKTPKVLFPLDYFGK